MCVRNIQRATFETLAAKLHGALSSLFLTLKFRSAAAGLCVGAAGLLRVGTAAVGSAGGRAGGHQQTVVVKSQAIVKVKPSEIFQFLRDLNGREVHSGCCRNYGAAFCRNGCVRTHADCH